MSRGKKLLGLALGKSESDNKNDVFDFKNDDNDPWESYNKWRANTEHLEKIHNTYKVEYTPERSSKNSSTIISSSSISWKPDEDNIDSDISNSNSTSKSEILSLEEIQNIQNNLPPLNHSQADLDETQDIQNNLSTLNHSHRDLDEIQNIPSNLLTLNCDQTNLNQPEQGSSRIQILSNVILTPTSSNNNQEHLVSIKNCEIATSKRNARIWDKKDRCPFCYKDVTNFSRHLFRNHKNEESVINILNFSKGSKDRKKYIDFLRKEGNFSAFYENKVRPVQRPTSNLSKKEDFLPCIYCKGLYKTKSLGRHSKKCFFNSNQSMTQIRHASEAQTILAFTESRRTFLNRLRLKTEVFPTMHADRISLNGKKDPIICQYAEDYLRKHKRPHIKNLVANKIRELGRFLIPMKEIYKIDNMLDALKPENYDKVVSAVRIISGYNETDKSFQAPSLALHFKTILLSVCSAAKTLLLKKDPILPVTDYDNILKKLKDFRELVDYNWKFEMGSLALKDLNEKCSTRPKKIPISNDIILFKDYCYALGTKAIISLRKYPYNLKLFKDLIEVTLALTILINRKRIGDVQYLKQNTYHESENNFQKDCFDVLTDVEKEISKNFKRVVTIGKGSKPVPILFPRKIQEYIEVIFEVRNKTDFIPTANPYLFALPGSTTKWIDGSRVLRKFAANCGAENPLTLTSSRLRKQIATVLQILNLNEIEMEQVASFMGHTKKTHEEFYRLPQELFQTSKIAKLLLMMERGVNKDDQGKSLEQLDIELETDELLEIQEKTKDASTSNMVESNTTFENEDLVSTQEIKRQQIKKLATFIRANAGRKSIPAHYFKQVAERARVLEDFYRYKILDFDIEKSEVQQKRPVVWCNSEEILEEVIQRRRLVGNYVMKIMADGGQGFLKCV
ncbi:unnamed protein product [Brassicogethes aeneus]|uniref:Uncharacterized protein n=1 Tax=Brassicogethes aeneus TaxID=1431903 RepID=A0A9P0FK83_BRAAE|nr:unnamed protein product [Brassicogethes aeneus]